MPQILPQVLPQVRVLAAGASVLLLLGTPLTGAAAQSTTGAPMPLLQFVQHGAVVHHENDLHHGRKLSTVRRRSHATLAERHIRKRPVEHRFAKRVPARPHDEIAAAQPAPAETAASTLPQNVWPGPAVPTPTNTAALAPDRNAAPVTTEAVVDDNPNQIVGGDHSVQTALPNGLNAANPIPAPPVKALASTTVPKAAAVTVAAAAPTVHAMMVKAVSDDGQSGPVGSASWIAHVLAALGGAIAAGAVAWFLIRPAPERNYG